MKKTAESILKQIEADDTTGRVWIPRDFYGFSEDYPRQDVFFAMNQLAKQGDLRRIAPGFYDVPVVGDDGNVIPTDVERVIEAVRRRNDAQVVPDGATLAFELGIAGDIEPSGLDFLTDCSSRSMRVQDRLLQFKRAEPNVMAWGRRESGHVVLALLSLGEDRVDQAVVDHLRSSLEDDVKDDLREHMWRLRYWVLEVARKIVAD